ncbi:MAG: hypothetical protein JO372_09155 [Solirubrobacterales bacterium]|nr:hypothetical protein [Solirubrobacterales bacterium]
MRGRDCLLQLLADEDGTALRLRDLRTLGGEHQRRWDGSLPSQTPSSELVDTPDHRDRDCDRRLTLAFGAQLSNQLGHIISGDVVESSRIEPRPKMAVHDAAVLHLRRITEVEHWPVQPAIGGLAESQLGIGSNHLPAGAASGKIVSKPAGRKNPAVDGPPAKATVFVPEANLEDTGRTAVDRAFHPHTPRSR